ncbi:MAG: hypothetical protein ACMUIA_04810 [bacterium]
MTLQLSGSSAITYVNLNGRRESPPGLVTQLACYGCSQRITGVNIS